MLRKNGGKKVAFKTETIGLVSSQTLTALLKEDAMHHSGKQSHLYFFLFFVLETELYLYDI